MNRRARLRIVERVEKRLGGLVGKRIGLLGLAFKNNTDDTRESPAMDILRAFLDRGATVVAYDAKAVIHDPSVNALFVRVNNPYTAAEQADALVIATEWDEFRVLDPKRLKEIMRGTFILDGRNLLDGKSVRKAGLVYGSVGRKEE